MSKRFTIFTYGCQMNRYDTETITGYLAQEGYEPSDDPALADLILLNTCSIRDRAEQKVFSQLGRLRKLKIKNPDLKIGVCGCFATRDGASIASKGAGVDLVFGTQNISKLPELLGSLEAGLVCDTAPVEPDFTELAPIQRQDGLSAYVSIARGCDNYCSFCVVPHTRGPEWSKPSNLIVDESEAAVREGFREINLLGQNVNSYGKKIENELSFGGLLRRLDRIDGLKRLRFMTSHPQDCDENMIDAMAECESVCEHLHLPVQSGGNDVLRRMERGYTVEEYLSKVAMFKDRVPGGTLTSDVIIGFPGESEKDFEGTLEVMKEARFDNIYMFKYSPRPGTPAESMEGQLPEEVASDRFQTAHQLQREISESLHRELEGSIVEVMVEGPLAEKPRKQVEDAPFVEPLLQISVPKRFVGRSRGNHRVQFHVEGPAPRGGELVDVTVLRSSINNLGGVALPVGVAMEETAT
ncbi:MAG: tRNA (N6-isopentenyl adenosine(37)-C2)-methylthiotransferase MiaB [Nitrospinaceae bacterium]|nr:tRNA (N6-isopentenyl adenosine(37)-C2)-methylthiotransferase MiaB [Nitrospinaceae bacterium]MBT3821203.1 tRNA (N6-isopentenyl adenosine(37)-C2)-methylthiotransferase MiaB [Nitrospinaceae bacterium]MBT4429471.1 tRNA (N6-isopentenyl adenosine(37)-C2)-methylthiotransferase MiaB [Nitrospinaceae bacterium]MBT5367894.1 tRNA (N6-isopentenyl adenosine(37)-C2)-methylthiotransferase MiaB [Nitrospinaceae bacterium]MBT5947024.1 tRNA (N6-isopentenyl adenosine(37)-C2)-methylthiotransferase MiaB [Nitrospin